MLANADDTRVGGYTGPCHEKWHTDNGRRISQTTLTAVPEPAKYAALSGKDAAKIVAVNTTRE
jgi:hypothetical protein